MKGQCQAFFVKHFGKSQAPLGYVFTVFSKSLCAFIRILKLDERVTLPGGKQQSHFLKCFPDSGNPDTQLFSGCSISSEVSALSRYPNHYKSRSYRTGSPLRRPAHRGTRKSWDKTAFTAPSRINTSNPRPLSVFGSRSRITVAASRGITVIYAPTHPARYPPGKLLHLHRPTFREIPPFTTPMYSVQYLHMRGIAIPTKKLSTGSLFAYIY